MFEVTDAAFVRSDRRLFSVGPADRLYGGGLERRLFISALGSINSLGGDASDSANRFFTGGLTEPLCLDTGLSCLFIGTDDAGVIDWSSLQYELRAGVGPEGGFKGRLDGEGVVTAVSFVVRSSYIATFRSCLARGLSRLWAFDDSNLETGP